MVSPNKFSSSGKDVDGRQWVCSKSDYEWYWMGYGTSAKNSKRRKKNTLRNPTGERNLPKSCEKHSWAKSCCSGTPSMQGIALETRYLSLQIPVWMVLFSPRLSSLAGTLADNAHMDNTGGKKTLENKYSSINFPIRGKTTQRARKPALFLSSPGPADVPRAAEKSVCGKGQCLHYTPRLLPPPHVHHLPGRHEGGGPGTQESKVAWKTACVCDNTLIHLSVCI